MDKHKLHVLYIIVDKYKYLCVIYNVLCVIYNILIKMLIKNFVFNIYKIIIYKNYVRKINNDLNIEYWHRRIPIHFLCMNNPETLRDTSDRRLGLETIGFSQESTRNILLIPSTELYNSVKTFLTFYIFILRRFSNKSLEVFIDKLNDLVYFDIRSNRL